MAKTTAPRAARRRTVAAPQPASAVVTGQTVAKAVTASANGVAAVGRGAMNAASGVARFFSVAHAAYRAERSRA